VITSIIYAIGSFFGVISGLFGVLSRKSQEKAGKLEQRNDDLAATVETQKREEQAIANMSMDKDDIEKRLRDGEA
jgi:hypothetical protein